MHTLTVDEQLVQRALALSDQPTEQATVEEALRLYVRLKEQGRIRAVRGKLAWDGDLDAMRCDRD